MAVYKAPLKDIQFVLNEVLDVSQLAKLPGYEDATPDTIHAIIEEAAKLCENVLFPLNRTGDCLLYTSPSPRDRTRSRMPSSA